jgi:hypothetical protein
MAMSIAAAAGRLCEVIKSPPAARKSIPRTPGERAATAVAAPRSSETITPLKLSCWRKITRITCGEKAARCRASMRV